MRSAGLVVSLVALTACSPTTDSSGSAPPSDRLLVLEELGPPILTTVSLSSGETQPTFSVPSGGFAYELDVHDQTGEILLAYTAPSPDGGWGYDRSRIVRVDGSGNLTHVACADAPGVWCFYPLWGASDRAWFIQDGDGVGLSHQPTLSRVDLRTGVVTAAVVGATEPAVSPGGEHVAWVSVDSASGQRQLAVGNADGRLTRILVDTDVHADLGQPVFSADSATVYYVGISTQTVGWGQRIADWLIPAARAHQNHNLPADWWQVPTRGGPPVQLTRLNTIHYDGRTDPHALFTATREGVQRIDPITGDAQLVFKSRTVRALDWLPR